MGVSMVVNTEEEYTLAIEIDKQNFLPKIITKESEMTMTSEVQGFPALTKPPAQSHITSTLTINSCK